MRPACTSLPSTSLAAAWPAAWVPVCLFHRFTGVPCPTCGATRCVKALLCGDWGVAIALQPLIAAMIVAGALLASVVAGPGAWPDWLGLISRVGSNALTSPQVLSIGAIAYRAGVGLPIATLIQWASAAAAGAVALVAWVRYPAPVAIVVTAVASVLVSPIVTATLWEFLLSPVGGFVDTVLGWFGFAPTNWLQQLNTARYAIALTSGWKVLGVSVLVITAGLAAISVEYFEAAAVDGSGPFLNFFKITLPSTTAFGAIQYSPSSGQAGAAAPKS